MSDRAAKGVSVVIPIHNEQGSIQRLYQRLLRVLDRLGRPFEVIFIDDGSCDESLTILCEIARTEPAVRVIEFRRNFGQTAAMKAGIDEAQMEIIVMLDGDLQNDPDDIPSLIDKIETGFDVVHGWRVDRKDAWLNRKLPSRVANWMISRSTGIPVHDLGCTLRALRREIARELELYGEMHRFITILAHRRGARCAEVPVRHHSREFGKTKYGLGRVPRVIMDLITVIFLIKYFDSPMKYFGRFAVWCGLIATVAGCFTLSMKLRSDVDMTGNPLFTLTVLSILVGFQMLCVGIIGEVCARIYYSSSAHRSYAIRQIHECRSRSVNFRRAA